MNIIEVKKTFITGLVELKTKAFSDNRGLFYESFNYKQLKEIGIKTNFVQDNISFSKKNVIRGLHFQHKNPQAKLVSVVKGKVLDVAVDLRPHSKTFGKHKSTVLSSTENNFMYIPKGFAHGFLTLTDEAIFSYKCDDYYVFDDQCGIMYNDPDLNINWGQNFDFILSDKDKQLPSFADYQKKLFLV